MSEVEELTKKTDALLKKTEKIIQRGIEVANENNLLKSSEAMALKKAEFEYQLEVASRMIKSKAFPNMTSEQAWVLMKAGQELGLTEMESMTDLYIVNGSVQFHSKGIVKRFTANGYKISYENESDKAVTVIVEKDEERYQETVTDQDQILKRSRVMSFAKKNKMRYHGLRMIGNFYLPHLFGSVSSFDIPEENVEYVEVKSKDNFQTEKERTLKFISNCESIEQLQNAFETMPQEIQLDQDVLDAANQKRESLS